MNKKNLLFLGIGILIGLSSFFIRNQQEKVPNETKEIPTPSLTRAVTEDENVCPVNTNTQFSGAQVTFLPSTINDPENYKQGDLIGKPFNSKELSKDLYNPNNDTNPWLMENVDVDLDLNKETVYYGNIAMNHTPHVAYLVKDGKIIFVASGANIWINQSVPNGIEVTETLDWNIGKYKRTKYEYMNGKFTPVWHQISCDVKNE